MTTVDQLPYILQRLFTDHADKLGKATGFIRRARVWSGASFAQTLVFGWMQHPDASLSQLQTRAASCGSVVSIKSIATRLQEPEAASFIRALLGQALSYGIEKPARNDTGALPFSEVVLLDSTQITLPLAVCDTWKGSGNQNAARAAVKVQVHYGWKEGHLEMSLHHGITNDRALPTPYLSPGTLVIHDSGFFSVKRCQHYEAQQLFWLSPMTAQMTLASPQSDALNLAAWLAQFGSDQALIDQPVALTQQSYPVRLVALRLPPDVVQMRQERLKADCQRRYRRAPSANQLALCTWFVLLTNIPSSCSPDHLLALYRLRWQIELLFKLWKDEGHLDRWRSDNPQRILTEFYAKLLTMLVQHWLLVHTCWQFDDRSLVKAARALRDELARIIPVLCHPVALTTLLDELTVIFSVCHISLRPRSPTFHLLRDAFP